MAATNVNNLDGLSAVANIDATEETALKRIARAAVDADSRLAELFIGQMSAEGFTLTNGVGLRAYVQSPTAKIEHIQKDGPNPYMKCYVKVGSTYELVMERQVPDAYPAYA